jgi:hypothetical protein
MNTSPLLCTRNNFFSYKITYKICIFFQLGPQQSCPAHPHHRCGTVHGTKRQNVVVDKPVLWYTNKQFFPETKFLDVSFLDSSLLRHANYNPFYWQILKKSIPFFGFKNPYKNPLIKKTRVYS